MSNYEIDKSKIAPNIDAKIERINARLRAAGKMQDQPVEATPAPMPATAIAQAPGEYVAPEQCVKSTAPHRNGPSCCDVRL